MFLYSSRAVASGAWFRNDFAGAVTGGTWVSFAGSGFSVEKVTVTFALLALAPDERDEGEADFGDEAAKVVGLGEADLPKPIHDSARLGA